MEGSPPTAAPEAFALEPYSYAEVRALVEGLRVAEPVAVTLVRRGHRTPSAARAFLAAAEEHDPFAFEAMAEVVERLRSAAAEGTRITVHGDYDVDGVCATAILLSALRRLGADCDWYIPGRLEDGYGLTSEAVERLASRGTEMLITADCGISCAAEVAAARRLGIEVIVTDHHQPGEEVPDCPILHPRLSGYPFAELCAAGVAHKLAEALHGPGAVAEDLDLVALATVADLVPLRGENRSLVRRGLAEARRARRPGLRALLEVASTSPDRLDEGDIAFRLAPRINAAGRLYRADAGVELMLTADEARAREVAAELDRANRERRAVETEVLEAATRALRELPEGAAEERGLVVAGEGWHPGVVGIVASRLVERYGRPSIVLSVDSEGRARGSGRGVPGFDLLGALRACDAHLSRYGGHRAAAGLELAAAGVGAFREAFAAHADEALSDADLARPEPVDAIVGAESLGHDVAEQLAGLGPFGLGNPGVRLLVPGARIGDVRRMGQEGRHARFSLRSGSGSALGVAFGANGELDDAAGEPHDVSVRLELNEWNGAVEPRVVLRGIHATASGEVGVVACDPDEFWERLEAERGADLDRWPGVEGGRPQRSKRFVVDRRGDSGVAAVASLASSGETVLVLCADALRRRELVERAVRPARFGGGQVAVLAARASLRAGRERLARLLDAGSGVALADWAALSAQPAMIERPAHVVVVDPAPHPDLDALASRGEGYLHRLDAGDELSRRVLGEEWPTRGSLASLFRALREAGGEAATVSRSRAFEVLAGEPSRPRAPEACGRRLRVLSELGLIRSGGIDHGLGVVSSGTVDLERSTAFAAYRRRHEEGERFLSETTQRS